MVLLLHLSFHKPMQQTITIHISVLHPEEIWENWFQQGILGGQKQSSGGGSANIRLITLALA